MDNSNDLFSVGTTTSPNAGQATKTGAKADSSKPASAKKPAATKSSDGYQASDIEVLEGLEPVRRRPGMYIGGTDSRAMHHLFAEVIDNSMDEAVAGQ